MGEADNRQVALFQGIGNEMKALHLSVKSELAETRTERRAELAETRPDLGHRIEQTNLSITNLDFRIATELAEVSQSITQTYELMRHWGGRLRAVEARLEERG